jgi:gentisate 1,2-dioxygenase
VLHVVEGSGTAVVDGVTHSFAESDTFAVPTHSTLGLTNASNRSPAYLFMVDDAPLQRKLSIYQVFE